MATAAVTMEAVTIIAAATPSQNTRSVPTLTGGTAGERRAVCLSDSERQRRFTLPAWIWVWLL
jgi:hypothetical protein